MFDKRLLLVLDATNIGAGSNIVIDVGGVGDDKNDNGGKRRGRKKEPLIGKDGTAGGIKLINMVVKICQFL